MVFGATGLVGSELVQQLIASPEYDRVILVNRRKSGFAGLKITEIIVDFDRMAVQPESLSPQIATPVQVVFCALGTTIKTAGSQDAFYRVDHDYVLMSAKVAEASGVSSYVAVSAIATDLNSKIFYSRVKAQAERDIGKLPLANKASIHFLRPSLLLGNRKEFRFGERLSIVLAPLFNWMMVGPMKRYKAIQASQVAASMIRYANDLRPGVHIHENENLF